MLQPGYVIMVSKTVQISYQFAAGHITDAVIVLLAVDQTDI